MEHGTCGRSGNLGAGLVRGRACCRIWGYGALLCTWQQGEKGLHCHGPSGPAAALLVFAGPAATCFSIAARFGSGPGPGLNCTPALNLSSNCCPCCVLFFFTDTLPILPSGTLAQLSTFVLESGSHACKISKQEPCLFEQIWKETNVIAFKWQTCKNPKPNQTSR